MRTRALPASSPGTAHAGLVTRVLAACVDAAGVFLVALAVDLAAAGIRFAWAPARFQWPSPTALVTSLVLLAVAVGYLAVAWATTGRTYGDRLLGLRVLDRRHGLLGWMRSVLRALAYVLFPVGLLWCGVSVSRRSVQDILFRSVVVYDAQPFVDAVER